MYAVVRVCPCAPPPTPARWRTRWPRRRVQTRGLAAARPPRSGDSNSGSSLDRSALPPSPAASSHSGTAPRCSMSQGDAAPAPPGPPTPSVAADARRSRHHSRRACAASSKQAPVRSTSHRCSGHLRGRSRCSGHLRGRPTSSAHAVHFRRHAHLPPDALCTPSTCGSDVRRSDKRTPAYVLVRDEGEPSFTTPRRALCWSNIKFGVTGRNDAPIRGSFQVGVNVTPNFLD